MEPTREDISQLAIMDADPPSSERGMPRLIGRVSGIDVANLLTADDTPFFIGDLQICSQIRRGGDSYWFALEIGSIIKASDGGVPHKFTQVIRKQS